MTRAEWQRIKGIAAAALAEPEADRLAFVAARCGSDDRARREVLSLLDATAKASRLHETPSLTAVGAAAILAEAEQLQGSLAGRRIGAYRIIAELGRGGMGAAYLAERADDAFERRVAIKLIKRGMDTDAIRLSRASRLRVIARDSVQRYRGRDIDPQEVGRELAVQAVLTGRVVQRGRDLSVAAELIDARDRRRLWGERYDRSANDVQFVQRELAQHIANALRLQFSSEELTRFNEDATRDVEAYQQYLKGRYFWNRRTAADMLKSVGYCKQAVARDPLFALAYTGLADSYGLLTEYHEMPARDTYPDVSRAVYQALGIDDRLAEAHTSLGYLKQFYEWDLPGAEREFKRAIEINPTYATAHQWYAEHLSAMGRHDEALAEITRAEHSDPLSLIVDAVEANILYMARRYDDAIEQSRSVIDMDPNFAEVYEYLKRSYDQKEAFRDAIYARQTRRRILGRPARETAALTAAATATGRQAYWRRRLEQEIEESKTEGLQPFEFAEILAQAGETTRALDWLEKACDAPDFMMVYLGVAPNLDPRRGEPRFQELVRRRCRSDQPVQPLGEPAP